MAHFVFNLCLNCGLSRGWVGGEALCKWQGHVCLLSLQNSIQRIVEGKGALCDGNIRICIANSYNGEEPRMIKTLAVKPLCSESELWSTSQQFLNLEIHLTSCFSSMPINHIPESNTYCHLSNQTSKTTGHGNADKDVFYTFSSFILMLPSEKKKTPMPNLI